MTNTEMFLNKSIVSSEKKQTKGRYQTKGQTRGDPVVGAGHFDQRM